MLFANAAPRPRSISNQASNFMEQMLAPCQVIAIAPYEFADIAPCYSIGEMKTIGEIRRNNLLKLLEKHGTLANLNEKLQLVRTDATLSQIKNQSTTSRGKPKAMGHQLARRIEVAFDLGRGWMDADHGDDGYRQDRISHAVAAMENMPELQFDQAIQIIQTLSKKELSPELVNTEPASTAQERDAIERRLDKLGKAEKPKTHNSRRRNAS